MAPNIPIPPIRRAAVRIRDGIQKGLQLHRDRNKMLAALAGAESVAQAQTAPV
jgi:hypothetical protein